MSNNLPIYRSNSIAIRVDDSNMALMKAAITGPSDSPYYGGVFIFDLFIPK